MSACLAACVAWACLHKCVHVYIFNCLDIYSFGSFVSVRWFVRSVSGSYLEHGQTLEAPPMAVDEVGEVAGGRPDERAVPIARGIHWLQIKQSINTYVHRPFNTCMHEWMMIHVILHTIHSFIPSLIEDDSMRWGINSLVEYTWIVDVNERTIKRAAIDRSMRAIDRSELNSRSSRVSCSNWFRSEYN